jgi:glycosyltransferase involved in cell wall biosynthesis
MVARARSRYELPEHFLVHLSTIEPRKNLDRLLDALQLLRHDFPSCSLSSSGPAAGSLTIFLPALSVKGWQRWFAPLAGCPTKICPPLLAAADLAVQPSLYEGFGLPILEAMATGQAVAASNSSSHPEVGGDAAAYFDPTDVAEMAAVIGRLLHDPDEVAARQRRGLSRRPFQLGARGGKPTRCTRPSR